MLAGYDQVHLDIDPTHITSVSITSLPENWNDPFPAQNLREIGDVWFDRGESVVFEVPSVILPQEKNYLVNPTHDQFGALNLGNPETITLDPRLFFN
jgi:RES domain-containing protein